MTFEVTILGSNSALPAHGRHPTSQVLNYKEQLFLLDCGEGTQIRIAKLKIKHFKIDHIFISHLHGDHFFGLIGMITSYHLNHREHPLTLHCPEGLEEIIQTQLRYSGTELRYPLIFKIYKTQSGNVIFENNDLTVTTVELIHRIPCAGFVFREKPRTERNIRKEKIDQYEIPVEKIKSIKQGADLQLPNGNVIPNDELTFPIMAPRSYAYCTDTAYNEKIIPHIEGVNLLYHEATFDKSNETRAKETFHCTTTQAATIAQKAQVKQLLIGHFSARYQSLEMLRNEARSVFKNTELATEGSTFTIAE